MTSRGVSWLDRAIWSGEHTKVDRQQAGQLPLIHRPAIAWFCIAVLWASYYLTQGHFWTLVPSSQMEESEIAAHLARGHGFASPFDPTHAAPPSSWSPPVYPFVLSLAYRVWGIHAPTAVAVMRGFNVLCYGLVVLGLFLIAARVFSRAAGHLSCVFVLLHPMFLRWTWHLWDTYPALALFVGLVAVLVWVEPRQWTSARMAMFGAVAALLVLTNVSYILTVPAMVLIALRGRRMSVKCAPMAAALAGFVLVMVPWTIRNYVVFNQWIPVRNGAAFELWFGNRSSSTGWLNSDAFAEHPGHHPVERQLILNEGEPAYFTLCRERFLSELSQDPAAFIRRCAQRVSYVLISDPTDVSHYPLMPDWRWNSYVIDRLALNSVVVVLGLAGAWTAWRLKYPAAALLGLGVLTQIPFVATSVWDRQTLPLRAMLLVFMAHLATVIFQYWRSGCWRSLAGSINDRDSLPTSGHSNAPLLWRVDDVSAA